MAGGLNTTPVLYHWLNKNRSWLLWIAGNMTYFISLWNIIYDIYSHIGSCCGRYEWHPKVNVAYGNSARRKVQAIIILPLLPACKRKFSLLTLSGDWLNVKDKCLPVKFYCQDWSSMFAFPNEEFRIDWTMKIKLPCHLHHRTELCKIMEQCKKVTLYCNLGKVSSS